MQAHEARAKALDVIDHAFKAAAFTSKTTWQAVPDQKALRARVISFLHRMVECLGERLLPCLAPALAALLPPAAYASEVADVVALLSQLALRYKASVLPLMAQACACPFIQSSDATIIRSWQLLLSVQPTLDMC